MRTTKNYEYMIPRRESKSEPPQCKSWTSTILQDFETKNSTCDISILCLPHFIAACGCQPRTRFTCIQRERTTILLCVSNISHVPAHVDCMTHTKSPH